MIPAMTSANPLRIKKDRSDFTNSSRHFSLFDLLGINAVRKFAIDLFMIIRCRLHLNNGLKEKFIIKTHKTEKHCIILVFLIIG